MAQVPNIADLTIGAVEVQDLSQMIPQTIFQDENFLSMHQVVEGITKKTQILFDKSSGKVGWLASGCGAVQSNGAQIKIGEDFWLPVTIKDMLDYCQAELDQNFKPIVLKNSKDKFADLENQEAIKVFVYATLTKFLKEAIERLAWLGDTDVANVADGGLLIDTVNVKFYNPIDGFWKQIFTNVVAENTPRVTIAANAQATKALQMSTMTDEESFKAIRAVYDNAPDALKLDPAAFIDVTPRIYNGYKNYLMSGALSGGGITELIVNGMPTVAYQGVPLKVSLYRDKLVKEDFIDGVKYNLPHRIIMATPELLPVATISTDDMEQLASFYVEKEEKSYVKFAFDLDAKLIRPDMVSVGY